MIDRTIATHVIVDKASVSSIRRAIRADFTRAGIDPAGTFDCLLAVTEACTNALAHGMCVDVDERHPEVSWHMSDQSAIFRVQDYSTKRWSLANHPAASALGDLKEKLPEGFGIGLMRELMDDVEIHVGPRGTTVVLTKHLNDRGSEA